MFTQSLCLGAAGPTTTDTDDTDDTAGSPIFDRTMSCMGITGGGLAPATGLVELWRQRDPKAAVIPYYV